MGITSWSCSDDYDDSALWKEINDLKSQVEKLNSDLAKVQTTVSKLESGKYVTDYTKTTDGCTLTFNDGSTVTVENGIPGTDAPVIGIQESNGVFYWTLTINGETNWLTTPAPESKMIPVSGKTPVMGVDAEGYWTVDNIRLEDDNNNPVKAGVDAAISIFTDSEETEESVTLTLAGGDKIVLPKVGKLTIEISMPYAEFAYGQKRTFAVTLKGVEKTTFNKPDGWKVDLTDGILTVTSPVEANTYADTAGVIAIIGMRDNSSCMAELKVACGKDGKVLYSIDGGTSWSETAPSRNASGESLMIKSTFGATLNNTAVRTVCSRTAFNSYDLSGLVVADADLKQAFANNKTVTEVILPPVMNELPDKIFSGCEKLASFEMPGGVTAIGEGCFNNCYSLASLQLPSTLERIGESAFAGMYALTKMEIPEGVTYLGKMMFYCTPGNTNTSHLKEVTIPGSVTDWQIGPITTGSYWFLGCKALEKIVCYVPVPVEVETDETWGDFKDVPSTCVIYVPDASISAYQATEGWQNFTIKGISELQ